MILKYGCMREKRYIAVVFIHANILTRSYFLTTKSKLSGFKRNRYKFVTTAAFLNTKKYEKNIENFEALLYKTKFFKV